MTTAELLTLLSVPALYVGVVPANAGAQLYVTALNGNNTIRQYSTSGALLNTSLVTGLNNPEDLVVSDGKLFVVNSGNGAIGEYDATTGAPINPALIPGVTGNYLGRFGIAVSGSDLYVTNKDAGTVSKYTTSGATINSSLITGLQGPSGIVVSGTDLFVANSLTSIVGKYTTSGGTVSASFITGSSDPISVAISGNKLFVLNHLFTLGEYDATTGATINASLISGLSETFDVALLGNDLFVTDTNASRVGQYTTSGATVNASLISGFAPLFIAAAPEPSSAAVLLIGAASLLGRHRRRSRARPV